MAIAGTTQELSLADLLQVKAMAGGSCRIIVDGRAGAGLILLDHGRVVHAQYGDLQATDAVFALLTEEGTYFQAKSGVEIVRRTMSASAQELVMEAARRQDEGILVTPKPSQAAREGAEHRPVELSGDDDPPTLPSFPAQVLPADDGGSRTWRPWMVALLVLPLAAVAVLASTLLQDSSTPAVAPATAKPEILQLEPKEATDLAGPSDRLPVLEAGAPPASPEDTSGLKPTIVLRLLIGVDGRVQQAQVYRPREELEAFERIALETVRSYRFSPGLHRGAAVPVWINWPVDFI
ncbi:MAG: DUF4388 domain-containing protein [Acidobacteriota bacterium]|nr:DUF4388 domain-containing protein [Acidobacteriota bacterium]